MCSCMEWLVGGRKSFTMWWFLNWSITQLLLNLHEICLTWCDETVYTFCCWIKMLQTLKPGFHYPSWRVTGFHYRRIPLARVSTSRVDGPCWLMILWYSSTRLVETRARKHGPSWPVMETGHPSTRLVETGL